MRVTGAIGGMKIGRGNRSTLRKPALAPLCPPQIPHDQTRAQEFCITLWKALILFLNLCNDAHSGEANCHCVILEIPMFYGIGSSIVRFEVLTVAVMKNIVFWDITPCSSLKVNWRFGGTSPRSSGSKNKPSKKPQLHVADSTGTRVFLYSTAQRRDLGPNQPPIHFVPRWSGTKSTGYCGHFWPIVQAPDDTWGWLWSNWWNEDWQRKPKYSEKTGLSATLSTTDPTWPDPGSNSGRRGGKPATNRLSYGAAWYRG
jgi:hypothetical protein